jgi:DNA-binding LytR/AlgR family response regulator
MTKLRVLIADDEKPARSKMRRLLDKFDFVEIVHEAENGLDALENIRSLKPDVAFLDIEMPGLNGLDVASDLSDAAYAPYIVFATAYNEHAIKAFELNAIDYLLKPFNEERLGATLEKIQSRGKKEQVKEQQDKIKNLSDGGESTGDTSDADFLPFSTKIPVPTFDRYLLIDFDDVVCIEVEDRNTILYTLKDNYTMNHTLEYFELKLPAERFFRANRSALVGLNHVKEIVIWFGNRFKIILKNGREVICSRERSRVLRDVLRF